MPADPEELVALMPFARQLGVVVDEASADRVVARLDWAPQVSPVGHVPQSWTPPQPSESVPQLASRSVHDLGVQVPIPQALATPPPPQVAITVFRNRLALVGLRGRGRGRGECFT